jgi:serine/threonine-protein kinase HipA
MPYRKAHVYNRGRLAGIIEETSDGYRFTYDAIYVDDPTTAAVSLTLPKRPTPHASSVLFPFFFGLLAEGNTKVLQCRELKLDENDHFGRLIKTAHSDVIGTVTVEEVS